MPEFDWDTTPIGVVGVTTLRLYLRWLGVAVLLVTLVVAAAVMPTELSASLAIAAVVLGVWYAWRVGPWLRYHRHVRAQRVLHGRCTRCDADVVKTLAYGLRACPDCGAELEPVSRLEKDRAAAAWKKRRRRAAAVAAPYEDALEQTLEPASGD